MIYGVRLEDLLKLGRSWISWKNMEYGSVVVKALCYKPEGGGFDTLWGDFLNLSNPSGRTTPWGLLSL
jgi:hypothetical protein